LLDDQEVRTALLDLVRSSPDSKIRNRALARIGRHDDPAIRELLLATLLDRQRELTERQTAARVLMRRPGADTTPVFLTILGSDEPASLLRFAALGLKQDGSEPEVAEALLELLLAEHTDVTARKNAATALSHAVRSADTEDEFGLEARLRSALTDLARQTDSGPVLAHAMGEVSRGLEGRFDDDLVGILRSNPDEEFRTLLVDDPTLQRFLEEL
jgi:hypothetical protein